MLTLAAFTAFFVLAVQGFVAQAADSSSGFGRQLKSAEETLCYHGCYADTFEYRALPRFLLKSKKNMTVELCHEQAILHNYPVFAVQYGRECWVSKGYRFARATKYGVSGDCNMTCTGNAAETCGGWLAFNLYNRGPCLTAPAPPSPAPSPAVFAPYQFSLVYLNSTAANCNATRDAVYNSIIVPAGNANSTVVRCSNSTGDSIKISTRFDQHVDLMNVAAFTLDFTNNAASGTRMAAGPICTTDSSSPMFMTITDNSAFPPSSVAYYFSCVAPSTNDTDVIKYDVASFLCCA